MTAQLEKAIRQDDTSSISMGAGAGLPQLVIHQHRLNPALRDYVIVLAHQYPFAQEIKVKPRLVMDRLAELWPDLPEWRAQATELQNYISHVIENVPIVAPMPDFLVRISASPEPLAITELPEPKEAVTIATYDPVAGVARTCSLPPQEELPSFDELTIPAGLMVVCQPVSLMVNQFSDNHPNDNEKKRDKMMPQKSGIGIVNNAPGVPKEDPHIPELIDERILHQKLRDEAEQVRAYEADRQRTIDLALAALVAEKLKERHQADQTRHREEDQTHQRIERENKSLAAMTATTQASDQAHAARDLQQQNARASESVHAENAIMEGAVVAGLAARTVVTGAPAPVGVRPVNSEPSPVPTAGPPINKARPALQVPTAAPQQNRVENVLLPAAAASLAVAAQQSGTTPAGQLNRVIPPEVQLAEANGVPRGEILVAAENEVTTTPETVGAAVPERPQIESYAAARTLVPVYVSESGEAVPVAVPQAAADQSPFAPPQQAINAASEIAQGIVEARATEAVVEAQEARAASSAPLNRTTGVATAAVAVGTDTANAQPLSDDIGGIATYNPGLQSTPLVQYQEVRPNSPEFQESAVQLGLEPRPSTSLATNDTSNPFEGTVDLRQPEVRPAVEPQQSDEKRREPMVKNETVAVAAGQEAGPELRTHQAPLFTENLPAQTMPPAWESARPQEFAEASHLRHHFYAQEQAPALVSAVALSDISGRKKAGAVEHVVHRDDEKPTPHGGKIPNRKEAQDLKRQIAAEKVRENKIAVAKQEQALEETVPAPAMPNEELVPHQ